MYYEVFRELCEKRGCTAADVSRGTGISTATLSSWKNGKYTPKIDKLQKIADYFHVSVTVFSADTKTRQNVRDNFELQRIANAYSEADEETKTVIRRLLGIDMGSVKKDLA